VKKWNMIIDIEKCEDCNNCFLACKDEYVDNNWKGYSLAQPTHGQRWMNIMRKERGQCTMIDVAYLPVPCMHCDNAPCIKAAKDGAAYKRDDGIVIIDPHKARGQGAIKEACPYGAIWWNEEENLAQKCTLCAHLIDSGWKEPRCVQACPTGALHCAYVEDFEMQEMIETQELEVLYPEYKTKPRVYYKNLYRYFQCFIGGSVIYEEEGRVDCAEGARVILMKDSQKIDEMLTDNFGDFKFDRLQEDSGKYIIEIFLEGYRKKTLEVDLTKSTYLGSIPL